MKRSYCEFSIPGYELHHSQDLTIPERWYLLGILITSNNPERLNNAYWTLVGRQYGKSPNFNLLSRIDPEAYKASLLEYKKRARKRKALKKKGEV
ncbi:MAG: hypothetical protein K6F15_04220 [Treponema sp.]|nr:hypothetical protein [Treponema sp.]